MLSIAGDVTFVFGVRAVGTTDVAGEMSNLASISMAKDATYGDNDDPHDDGDDDDDGPFSYMVIIACVVGAVLLVLIVVVVVLIVRKRRHVTQKQSTFTRP